MIKFLTFKSEFFKFGVIYQVEKIGSYLLFLWRATVLKHFQDYEVNW